MTELNVCILSGPYENETVQIKHKTAITSVYMISRITDLVLLIASS